MKNPNLLAAETFVSELARGGVREVCLAPGSRSTPLALAFAAHPQVRVFLHLDERSAAFFALGLGLALGRPVPVVCTSGSAAANFFPAVIEARAARVPLLLLTADRPPELRESGANQTIDQVKLYSGQVLWSVDLPVPEASMSELTLRHLRTLAARALARANGLEQGPVHLNFPFRKPLEPTPQQEDPGFEVPGEPFTRMERGVLALAENQQAALAALIQAHPRGLIICGPRCPGKGFPQALMALSQASGYPILADPLSGVRFGWENVLGGYDGFLAGGKHFDPPPQVILRFGGVPTSASLAAYLSSIQPAHRLLIGEHGTWLDDDHRTTWVLQADPEAACHALAKRLAGQPESAWSAGAARLEQVYWQKLDQALVQLQAGQEDWFDGAALAAILPRLPEQARLFVGNSLPVRNLDQFGRPGNPRIEVFGSRGASGIDGNVSTALGIAAADRSRPLIALLGDITLYHDLNGLYALRSQGLENVTIFLFNNNSGGIFQRLPVRRFEPPFTDLFLTPHNLEFEYAARLYGLETQRVETHAGLQEVLQGAWLGRPPRLVELHTNSAQDFERRKKLMDALSE